MANGVWNRVGSANAAAVSSGNLVFTAPGNVAAGDLVVACIAYRSNAPFTIPSGWTLINQQSSGDSAANGIASGVMAYIIWPGTTPDLTFTRTGGGVALGTLRAYRGQAASSPFDTSSANTLAVSASLSTTPSIITAEDGELLVAMHAAADDDALGTFFAVTDPATVNPGVLDVYQDPFVGVWSARTNTPTTTGADTTISVGDAIKGTAGATGELRYQNTDASRGVLIVAAFKSEPIAKAVVSKTARSAIVGPPNDSAVVSKTARSAIVGPPNDGPSVAKLSRNTILAWPKDRVLVAKLSRYTIAKPSTFVAPKPRAQNVNYYDAPPIGGPHRYWRLKIPSVGSGVVAAIPELQLYESYFGPNVATGGTASADSQFDSNYTPAEAFDGGLEDTASSNDTSVWASVSGGALPHWLAYDLGVGVSKEIKAIGIHGRVASSLVNMPTALALECSDDGAVWSEVWSKSGLSWSAFEYKRLSNLSPPGHSGSPHGSHSYWRIFINQAEGVAATSVTELEFRATPGGADQASGGTAAASSTYSGSFPASNAFDNNASTFWHNGASLEYGWLRYQFASPVSVAEIAVTARASGAPIGGPINIAVQYADSASGPWTTAWNVTGQPDWTNGETRTFTDPNYV